MRVIGEESNLSVTRAEMSVLPNTSRIHVRNQLRRARYTISLVKIENPVVARLRSAYRARTSRVEHRDANARRQLASADTDFAYSIRVAMTVEGRKVHVYVGRELARISVFGEFEVPLFTLNAADRAGFKSQRAGSVRIGVETATVYTTDGTITEVQKRVLDSKEMRTLVAFRRFREGEAIHFYRNVLVLYARNDDVTVELVAMVSALANAVPISTPPQPT